MSRLKHSNHKRTKVQNKDFQFRLLGVELVENFATDDVTKDEINGNGGLRYSLKFSFNLNLEEESIAITVLFNINYLIDGREKSVIEVKIINKYEVLQLNSWLKKSSDNDKWDIPESVGGILVSASIAQSRGIHAHLLKGHPLDGYYIPFVDVKNFKIVDNKE